ncbi:hypothetical protein HG1285_00055 [Hydrogenivirga sp. 128-5-R1-1]|nr:hypothetical protein HG1285_00055 [Hydrogenivirga sp. 128-5-R1-1]
MGNLLRILLGLALFKYFKKRRERPFNKTSIPLDENEDFIDLGGGYKMPTSAWKPPKLWGKIELRPPWGVRVHRGEKRR